MNRILHKIYKVFPAIRIHVWGGLGSQLYAAHLILKLRERYPNRRIRLLIHTSGVTRRECELDFGWLGVTQKQIDDFDWKHKTNSVDNSVKYRTKFYKAGLNLFRKMLDLMSIVKTGNDDTSLKCVKPWTLSLRGHYTLLKLERSRISALFDFLLANSPELNLDPFSLTIHYRLGDLLELSAKGPIEPKRIESLFKECKVPSQNTCILSDSSEKELARVLKDAPLLKSLKLLNTTPLETLAYCVQAEKFIGTNAKLSMWAAIFRSLLFDKESYLPYEMRWKGGFDSLCNWY